MARYACKEYGAKARFTTDILTNDRQLIEGPIPWGSILFPSVLGSAILTLVLLWLPALVGIVHRFVNTQRSGQPERMHDG